MNILKQKNTQMPSPLDTLQSYMSEDMKAVNAMIITHMDSSVPLIPQLASYLIASGGKRVRPLLTLASTALCGGDITRAHRLAAAVEFIHTATLLHDDVVDDSDMRRGQKSANTIFGNEASVLVGDFLFSRAFQLMVADGSLDILRVLSNASAIIAEGEVQQLSTQNNLQTTMNDYFSVIEGKTASLFAAACEVGPLIAMETPATINALRTYGMSLGMAFQIVDDVLDYDADHAKLGKTIGDDFREGKMTAPVLFALEKASTAEHDFWQRTIGDRNQHDGDLEKAQQIILSHDGFNQGLALARSFGQKAIDALTPLPPSTLKDILADIIEYVITRQY